MLVCPPELIFDLAEAHTAISAALENVTEQEERRSAIGTALRPRMEAGRETIAAALLDNPQSARPVIRSYTYLAESLARAILSSVLTHVHPLASPTETERMALMFVGGSGRAEMAPHSDIDMLFLTPYKQTAWGESVVESVLYFYLISKTGGVFVTFAGFVSLFAGIGWGVLLFAESHGAMVWFAVGLLCVSLFLACWERGD